MKVVPSFALALFLCAAPAGAGENEASFIQRTTAAIASKDPARIARLAGRSGAQILPFGVDVIPPPSPRQVFARRLLAVVGTSNPACVGYHVGSDKTIVFFSAAGLDWSKGGLDEPATDMMALHFYRPPNASARWTLMWASPITRDGIQLLGEPRPC